MEHLFILPCGRKKVWDLDPGRGETETKDVYIGTFHRLCRKYAENFGGKWVVLSAKHGYLLPSDLVEGPYDLSFSEKSEKVISIEKLQKQVRLKGLDSFSSIIVLTGKKYKPFVEKSMEESAPVIIQPLLGANGIGTMQKVLKEAVLKNKPIH